MSISQALSNAGSGLAAAARQAGVASNNIANALTPGFARRDVSLAERSLAGEGAGVRVAGVVRADAPLLTRERRAADGAAADVEAQAGALKRISDRLGGPEDPFSLFAKIAAFEQALRSLGDSPDSAAAQGAVLSAANAATSAFAQVAADNQAVRQDADQQIAAQVDAINRNLQEIERLNRAIAGTAASSADATALVDQRERLVDEINGSIPVRVIARGAGQIDLVTPEGVFLLAGTPRPVAFTPTPTIAPGSSYAGGAGTLSGLTIGGVDVTPGGPGGQALSGGSIRGLFAVRDEIAPEAASRLDALAEDLIGRLSAPGLDPTLAPGAPGLFTDAGAALSPPPAPGLAARIAVNAAVDPAQGGQLYRLRDGLGATAPGPAGANGLLRALSGALTGASALPASLGGGSGSVTDAAGRLSSLAAADRSAGERSAETASSYAASLSEVERAETGVDTDQELQRLLLIEQAYAANARVIETVDRLIQRLLET